MIVLLNVSMLIYKTAMKIKLDQKKKKQAAAFKSRTEQIRVNSIKR